MNTKTNPDSIYIGEFIRNMGFRIVEDNKFRDCLEKILQHESRIFISSKKGSYNFSEIQTEAINLKEAINISKIFSFYLSLKLSNPSHIIAHDKSVSLNALKYLCPNFKQLKENPSNSIVYFNSKIDRKKYMLLDDERFDINIDTYLYDIPSSPGILCFNGFRISSKTVEPLLEFYNRLIERNLYFWDQFTFLHAVNSGIPFSDDFRKNYNEWRLIKELKQLSNQDLTKLGDDFMASLKHPHKF
ncbi:MAG: hypothetical protein ACOYT4_04750 [Nanoarchaeota archaeon]